MVATAATAAFFPVLSSSSSSSSSSTSPATKPSSVSFGPKPASSNGSLQVKANAQVATKNNDTKVGLKTDPSKIGNDSPSLGPRTFYNQLPDWSVLLAAITTIFLAAEKQWTLLDWKPKRPDMISDAFGLGKLIENGLVYRQNFYIRSYEIGADKTASIETLMNHLQETALNHASCVGLMGDGFGSTPEMSKRNLIWVVTKMQVSVECYPSWGDVIEVDTWVSSAGKNGMRRDWYVHNRQTGQTIMRATSNWVMMNKQTRKLSKFPEEVRTEIQSYFMERGPVIHEDNGRLPKLNDNAADHVLRGLMPRWSDLDVNQHVNNVKYIGWILEGAPISIFENSELASMTLEYRRECGRGSVLQSLTAVSTDCTDGSSETSIECQHLLRLETGPEIVRGRTEWRPKNRPVIVSAGRP
ncbi:palmitoyl-acyl carrier protein thioesterase, chloroplastic-like [Asparagus officinalis]|uniref:palmitoyl-acyl carrier protein thioesterase, chloroplastic-like n=1 Tax=Asparagus officinalis TaxID=4686 RepID=UPI00098E36F0|nr:palmitoyl-acyl carrier protein thioesterase, chloroplastic-like [Asparagus officinalis]